MSSNERIPVAANVLGTIGTVFWCVQLVPQIWHNWRQKKTDGLPQSMMLLWAMCMLLYSGRPVFLSSQAKLGNCLASIPFGVYMILQVCLASPFILLISPANHR